MCYGKPEELLAKLLEARPLTPNDLGHTAQDDFEHFCAYSGLSIDTAGPVAFAWARYAYYSVWRPERVRPERSA
jgi:hypothetical protein